MDIVQKQVTSCGERRGSRPLVIVNHISAGAMKGMYNHFSNPVNQASSHFGISRKGEIIQYVPLDRAAWTQGRIQAPTAPIIKQLKGNPNRYCVSIEHEGWAGNGLDGSLTEEQFIASCWLHKYIQTEIEGLYGHKMPLNSHHVIGHYQIDSIGKPFCPGMNFPWSRLYAELARADGMTLLEYEEELNFKKSAAALGAESFAFFERFTGLRNTLDHPIYGPEARRKVLLMAPVMAQMGLDGEPTAEAICDRMSEFRKSAVSGGKWVSEALRKTSIGIQHAKNVGLIV